MDRSTKLRAVFDIVQAFFKTLECAICLELMEDPLSTGCNHNFCRNCILTVLKKRFKACCPLCNTSITRRGLYENLQLVELVKTAKALHNSVKLDSGYDVTPPRPSHVTMLSSPEGRSSLQIFNLLHPTPFKQPALTLKGCEGKRGRKRKLDVFMDEDSSSHAVKSSCSSSNTNIRSGFPLERKSKPNHSSSKEDENAVDCEAEKTRNEKLAQCFQTSLLRKRKVGRPFKTRPSTTESANKLLGGGLKVNNLGADETLAQRFQSSALCKRKVGRPPKTRPSTPESANTLLGDDLKVNNLGVDEMLDQRFQSSALCKRKVGRPPKNHSIDSSNKLLGDDLAVTNHCDDVKECETDSKTSRPLHLFSFSDIKPILEESIFELPSSWIPQFNKDTDSRDYSKANLTSAKKKSNTKEPKTPGIDAENASRNDDGSVCNETATARKQNTTLNPFHDSFGIKKKIFRSRNNDYSTNKSSLGTEKVKTVDAYTFFPSQRTPRKRRGRKPKCKKGTENTLDKHLNLLSKKMQAKNGLPQRFMDISLSSSELCGVALANKENLKKSGQAVYDADPDFAIPKKKSKSVVEEDDIILFCTPACAEEPDTPTKKCTVALKRLDPEVKNVRSKHSVKNKNSVNRKGSFPSTQEKITTLAEEIASAESFELSINGKERVKKTKQSIEKLMETGKGSAIKTANVEIESDCTEKLTGPSYGKTPQRKEKRILNTIEKGDEMQKEARKFPSMSKWTIFNLDELDTNKSGDVHISRRKQLKDKNLEASKQFRLSQSEEPTLQIGKGKLSKNKLMQETREGGDVRTLHDEPCNTKQGDKKREDNEELLAKNKHKSKESAIQGNSLAKGDLDPRRCELEVSRNLEMIASSQHRDNRESMKDCSFQSILTSDSDSDSEPIPYIYMEKRVFHSSQESEANLENEAKVAEDSAIDQRKSDSNGHSIIDETTDNENIDDLMYDSSDGESIDENKDMVPKSCSGEQYQHNSTMGDCLDLENPLAKAGQFSDNNLTERIVNGNSSSKENVLEEVKKLDSHSEKGDLADDEDDFDIDNLEMYIKKSDRKTFTLDVPTLELEELGKKASTLEIINEVCANLDIAMPDEESILPKTDMDSHAQDLEGLKVKTTEHLLTESIDEHTGIDQQHASNSLEGSSKVQADDHVINSKETNPIHEAQSVLKGKQIFSSLNENDGFQSKMENSPSMMSKISDIECTSSQNFSTNESISSRKLVAKTSRRNSQSLNSVPLCFSASVNVSNKEQHLVTPSESKLEKNSSTNVNFSEGCLKNDDSLMHYLSAVARRASCPSCQCSLDIRFPKVTILVAEGGVKCTLDLGEAVLVKNKSNRSLQEIIRYEANDSKQLSQECLLNLREEYNNASQPVLVKEGTMSSGFNSQINSSMLRDNPVQPISKPCSDGEMCSASKNQDENDLTDSDIQNIFQESQIQNSNVADAEVSPIKNANANIIGEDPHLSDFEDDFEDTSEVDRFIVKKEVLEVDRKERKQDGDDIYEDAAEANCHTSDKGHGLNTNEDCSLDACTLEYKSSDDESDVEDVMATKTEHIESCDVKGIFHNSQSGNVAKAEPSPIKNVDANANFEEARLSDFGDDFEDTSEVDRLIVEKEVKGIGSKDIRQTSQDINVDAVFDENTMGFSDTDDILEAKNNNSIEVSNRQASDEGHGLNSKGEDSCSLDDACTVEYKSTDDDLSDVEKVEAKQKKHNATSVSEKEPKMAEFLKFNDADTDDPDYKFADSLVAPLKNFAAQQKAANSSHPVKNGTSKNLPLHSNKRGKSLNPSPERSPVPKKFRRIKRLSNSSSTSAESQALQSPSNPMGGKNGEDNINGVRNTRIRTVIIVSDDESNHNENLDSTQNMAKVIANINADLSIVVAKDAEKIEENKAVNTCQDEMPSQRDLTSCCTAWSSQSIPRTTQDKVKIQMEIEELKKTIKKMESQLGKIPNYQSTEEQPSCKENMKSGPKTPKRLVFDSDEEMFSPPIPPTPPRQAAGTVTSRSKFSVV